MDGKMSGKKKKLGRPLASPQPRDNSLTIRLNSTELAALTMWCERYDQSVSDVLRDLMMLHSIIPDNPKRFPELL